MKPDDFAASSFERAMEVLGGGDHKKRFAELLVDAMHWMAINFHQIDDMLGEARQQFRQEAQGNEGPEPFPDNAKRAERCENYLLHYGTDNTHEGCLTDFLTDARHWCHANVHDFDRIAATAEQHFQAEVIETEAGMQPLPSPGEVAGQAAETPLERIGRQIRELKSRVEFIEIVDRFTGPPVSGFVDINQEGRIIGDSWAQLSESRKLEQLDRLDWQGVTPLERLCVVEGEVDLNRVSPKIQRVFLDELRERATLPTDKPLPSPSEIARDPRPYLPGPGDGNGNERER